jgi:hypothetical protein
MIFDKKNIDWYLEIRKLKKNANNLCTKSASAKRSEHSAI